MTVQISSPIVDFATRVLGFALTPGQEEIVTELYASRSRIGVLRCGRRGGKSRMAAVVATYEATVNAATHLAAVPSGERVYIGIVANSREQAAVGHRYVREFLNRPKLRSLIVRETADEIALSNNIVITTLATNARSLRGRAVAVAILDEFAWLYDDTGSAIAAEEVWSAVVPAVSQFPGGKVLVLSTPRWSSGLFYELCEQADSGLYPDMRHWHRPTSALNPAIPASVLAAEKARDPAAYRREYLAEWDSGIGALFPEELVRAALRPAGSEIIPPAPNVKYVIATDPAYLRDRWTVVVGHRDRDQIVIDRVTGWEGSKGRPVDHETALSEIAALSKAYHGAHVVTDQHAGIPITQGLQARGLVVSLKPWTNANKAEAATATRQVLTAGNLSLPRHQRLVSELLQLEQRPTPSGQTRIAGAAGSHDDYAIALMAACLELTRHKKRMRALGISPKDPALDAWRYMP